MTWNPLDTRSWANSLGLAHSNLFANPFSNWDNAALLDGRKSSITLLIGDDADMLFLGDEPLSWSWSSFINTVIAIDRRQTKLFARHWKTPSRSTQLRVPRSAEEAWALCDQIAVQQPKQASADVVSRMISAFKWIRASLSPYDATNTHAIQLFNHLLDCMADPALRSDLRQCATVEDVVKLSDMLSVDIKTFRSANLTDAIDIMLADDNAATRLEPELLIRHAAGHLYQEAHFELERMGERQHSLFGGLAPNTSENGIRRRDARFTPPELARSLACQALQFVSGLQAVTVLDPACGSGVFLTSALQELQRLGFKGDVTLKGFDQSDVSVEICRYCLRHACLYAAKVGITATATIETCDAFAADWGTPDVILMNPPFTRWRDMTAGEQSSVEGVLGDLMKGHSDKAMAFVTKAARAIADNGVIATVIPSTLLDGNFSVKWREDLLSRTSLQSVGRLNGYSYFPGALVEPAYAVLCRNPIPSDWPLIVAIAENGMEDRALRELRRLQLFTTVATDDVFVSSEADRSLVTSTSWMPRTFRHQQLLAAVAIHPPVGELFDVLQGALTGCNDAFIVDAKFVANLPAKERRYFRVSAGASTIRNCAVSLKQYVFFPYDENGELLATEEELQTSCQTYYSTVLQAHRKALASRAGFETRWWNLTRPRHLDRQFSPKIVSAYFGATGSFAFDDTGAVVSTHGYLWWWKSDSRIDETDDDLDISVRFNDSPAPWAYLALLNSAPFEFLLSCFCSRVQGGQHNLSKRYVSAIPVPDLLTGTATAKMVSSLAAVGKSLHAGSAVDAESLTELVSRAYGVDSDAWPK